VVTKTLEEMRIKINVNKRMGFWFSIYSKGWVKGQYVLKLSHAGPSGICLLSARTITGMHPTKCRCEEAALATSKVQQQKLNDTRQSDSASGIQIGGFGSRLVSFSQISSLQEM